MADATPMACWPSSTARRRCWRPPAHARDAGYRRLDAFTPFPVDGLAAILRILRPRISVVGLIGGFAGAAFALLHAILHQLRLSA